MILKMQVESVWVSEIIYWMLMGALAGGVMGELVGLRETLVAASVVMIASGLYLVITPVWGMRESPGATVVVDATIVPEPPPIV